MKKADAAAGVKGDRKLSEGQWCVRATIEEMKGKFIQYVGQTHTILNVQNGEATWYGLPFLRPTGEGESNDSDSENTEE